MTDEQVSDASERVALVTGSAGFVAPAVCAELMRRGYVVRGYSRSGVAPPGVTAVTGDVRDRAALRPALRGVTVVVHLAARVHQRRERGATAEAELGRYRAVNVEGTRAVLEESIRADARRFIYFSSVKAVAESSAAPIDETMTPTPRDAYGISKRESEEVVRELADRHDIRASIMRLPLVYGPGVRANMLRLFRAIDRGLPLPLGAVRNRRSIIFTGNVAAATAAVIESPAAHGRTFFVSDGVDVSTPQLLNAIGEALRMRPRLVPVPVAALRLAGAAGDLLGRIAPSPVDSDLISRLTGSLQLDISLIRRVARYEPRYTLAQGMRASADWYRQEQM